MNVVVSYHDERGEIVKREIHVRDRDKADDIAEAQRLGGAVLVKIERDRKEKGNGA